MKKLIALALFVAFITHYAQAQTKVFKEVGDAISSQVKTIRQDNALVGYLVFTQLEKANEDSFNYRITIMDENLNDIGKVDFREQGLQLGDVAFDKDVLCIGYLKSNIIGYEYKGKKEFKAALANKTNAVFTQFINLDGKILKTNSTAVDVRVNGEPYGFSSKIIPYGKLTHLLQIKNISQKGFACFYGDASKNNMLVFDTKGDLLWQKKITSSANEFYMLTSGSSIYLLTKNNESLQGMGYKALSYTVPTEGGYQLLGYQTSDTTAEMTCPLKDANSNQLKVLSFDNDPVTGKPVLAGLVINPSKYMEFSSAREITKGPYLGLFTLSVNGNSKNEISSNYSYWNNGSLAGISQKGFFDESDSYAMFSNAFRDFNGNTYFSGSKLIKRVRWGSIASSVLTSWTIIGPVFIIGMGGIQKCKITDGMLIKQNASGALSFENDIPSEYSRFFRPSQPTFLFDKTHFYTVVNSDTKTNYLIVDDVKNISIYNVNQKKVQRTIPHKDGNIKTNVYPAKEGYVMVSEYNKKEKYTKFSIEAL